MFNFRNVCAGCNIVIFCRDISRVYSILDGVTSPRKLTLILMFAEHTILFEFAVLWHFCLCKSCVCAKAICFWSIFHDPRKSHLLGCEHMFLYCRNIFLWVGHIIHISSGSVALPRVKDIDVIIEIIIDICLHLEYHSAKKHTKWIHRSGMLHTWI